MIKKVKLSKENLVKSFNEASNLGELIRLLELKYEKMGFVICEVSVNNMMLTEEDESRLANASFSEVKNMEISLSKPYDLVIDTMKSTDEYLNDLTTALCACSSALREGREADAHKIFQVITDALQVSVEMLVQIRQVLFDVNQDIAPEKHKMWHALEKRFLDQTQSLLDVYEKEDTERLAAFLEKDLLDTIIQWQSSLRELLAQNETHAPTDV